MPFVGNPRQIQCLGIHMRLTNYLELLDCTGRILRNDKKGYINSSTAKILTRLNLNETQWLEMTSNFEGCFSAFVGNEKSLRMACDLFKYQRPPGLSVCKKMFQ